MERIRIAFLGPVNSGKSTLVNAIAGQRVSLVSPHPGTTTDPVRKAVELPGLGACILIDTAGLDDSGLLGPERERLTRSVLDEADIAVIVSADDSPAQSDAGIPSLTQALSSAGIPFVRYRRGQSVDSLLREIRKALPDREDGWLTASLVNSGDNVVLVMPQDSEAPKGRLILPQVQVLRELLDRGCLPHCCTPGTLEAALGSLGRAPELVITDSQSFGFVSDLIPREWPLTSFSVLLAAAKGDPRVLVEGAEAIDRLRDGDRVLIAEACTHVPDGEDIGRVKIPTLLRKRAAVRVDVSAGNDFPDDLSPYRLIIHCGACVAGKSLVRSRTRKALLAGVPITNYGIALAKLQGILDRVRIPGIRK